MSRKIAGSFISNKLGIYAIYVFGLRESVNVMSASVNVMSGWAEVYVKELLK